MESAFDNLQNSKIETYFNVCRAKYGTGHRAWCFVAVVPKEASGGVFQGQLAVAEYGVGGYTPLLVYFDTFHAADACSDSLNERLGVPMADAVRIINDTMKRPSGMETPGGVAEKSAIQVLEKLLDFLDESQITVGEDPTPLYAEGVDLQMIGKQLCANDFISTVREAKALIALTKRIGK